MPVEYINWVKLREKKQKNLPRRGKMETRSGGERRSLLTPAPKGN